MASMIGRGAADRIARFRLPDPPANIPPEIARWMAETIRALTLAETRNQQPMARGYTVTNFTELRTLDYDTASLDDVINFVCTLVSDLQKAGQIGGAA